MTLPLFIDHFSNESYLCMLQDFMHFHVLVYFLQVYRLEKWQTDNLNYVRLACLNLVTYLLFFIIESQHSDHIG